MTDSLCFLPGLAAPCSETVQGVPENYSSVLELFLE
jgi:hypothetical protein